MAERTEELQKKSPALPTAAQVIAYLRRHPDFLYRHPELLDLQAPPARHSDGTVVDLQHFMVERLRNDISRLRANQDEIIANSRDNLGTQERIHKAVLALQRRAPRSFISMRAIRRPASPRRIRASSWTSCPGSSSRPMR